MRTLVLGGTGFIGSPLVSVLSERGVDVVTLGRAPSADVVLDVLDPDALAAYLRREPFDVVVNLAGAGLATESVGLHVMQEVNALLPARALSVLLDLPTPPAFVHAASSTERQRDDEPHESEYSRTKHDGAQAVRALAADATTPIVLARIHNTYGPDQPRTRFVAGTIGELAAGRPVRLNYPGRVRDFVLVDDVARSIADVVISPVSAPREVELGTGVGTALRDLALTVARLLGRPASLVESAGLAVADPHPYAVAQQPGGTLGTCRTTLDEGLARTLRE